MIIGVGQVINRDDNRHADPITLALEAVERAGADTGAASCASGADTVASVAIVSWRYGDAARLVAQGLGAENAFTMYPQVGGNTPQLLMNRICERISSGTSDLAVLTGAESYRTRMRARRGSIELDWQREDLNLKPDWQDSDHYEMGHPAELELGIMMPTQAYPLFENALWHESGRTQIEHRQFIADLWAGLSAVASTNPMAWVTEQLTAEQIGSVTPENRLIGFPYTKAMVANPDVNMASAAIICSVERAQSLGISPDRWVFPQSGSDASDPFMTNRTSFTTSAAIRHAGRAALDLAGTTSDELDFVDVYSCFPSAVQIACNELEISTDRELTVYGGLPFGGGPWNNPVGHAIAAMVQRLREHPGATGLVTANGGNIQKHSYGVYSTEPPAAGFRTAHPQFAVDTEPMIEADSTYSGPATIETWTVMHERDGTRARAHAVLRTPTGQRCWATSSEPDLMELFESQDCVGLSATVADDHSLHLS